MYALATLPALLLMRLVVWVIEQRWDYPYQIEWIEGSVLQHAVRILEGLPVYTTPDMTFAPALYTPLYYYAGALVSWLTTPGLPALRVVSLFGCVLAAVAVPCITWQLTRSRLAAWLALPLVMLPFRFTGMWFDVARVDSLWAGLLLMTVLLLCRCQSNNVRWNIVGAAGCYALAVMTKQTSLFLAPFLLLTATYWAGWRAAMQAGVITAIVLSAFVAFFQWQSHGLFWFYTMGMAGHHQMTGGFPWHFFKGDLLEAMPVLLCLVGVFLVACWRTSRSACIGWAGLLLGVMTMTLLARLYAGGAPNVTMTMHWFVLPLAVAGFHQLVMHNTVWRGWIASILLAANIVWGGFVPQWFVPSAADRAYGDALVARLAAVSGRVCLSRDAYLGWMAGKGFCAHETQLTDILNGGNPTLAAAVVQDARRRILGGYYDVIVVDNLFDIGNYVDVFNIPYIGTPLDLDEAQMKYFNPVSGGPRPHLWLQLVHDRATPGLLEGL